MSRQSRLNRRLLWLAGGLLVLAVAAIAAGAALIRPASHVKQPRPNSGAGNPAGRGPTTESISPTPRPTNPGSAASSTPAARSLTTPVGDILNKTTVSLSASSADLQHNAAMVSTVFQSTPGSRNTIIAVSAAGQQVAVAQPAVADANGQTGEISWNAKTAGLTPGSWRVKIKSELNGAMAWSVAATLEVTQ